MIGSNNYSYSIKVRESRWMIIRCRLLREIHWRKDVEEAKKIKAKTIIDPNPAIFAINAQLKDNPHLPPTKKYHFGRFKCFGKTWKNIQISRVNSDPIIQKRKIIF